MDILVEDFLSEPLLVYFELNTRTYEMRSGRVEKTTQVFLRRAGAARVPLTLEGTSLDSTVSCANWGTIPRFRETTTLFQAQMRRVGEVGQTREREECDS